MKATRPKLVDQSKAIDGMSGFTKSGGEWMPDLLESIWSDFNDAKRQANRGLFDSYGNPWRTLLSRLREAHRRIAASFYPYQSRSLSAPIDLHVILNQ